MYSLYVTPNKYFIAVLMLTLTRNFCTLSLTVVLTLYEVGPVTNFSFLLLSQIFGT